MTVRVDLARPQLAEPVLPLASYRLTFEALDGFFLAGSQGSFWRSAIGKELQAYSTGKDLKALETDSIPREELYRYLFETPPPLDASKMRRYPNAPHPYVITAPCKPGPQEIASGSSFGLKLTLFGRGNEALPAIVAALTRAGEAGLGSGRGRGRAKLVRLESVSLDGTQCYRGIGHLGDQLRSAEVKCPMVPPMPGRVSVSLDTPLQLLIQKPAPIDREEKRPGKTRRVVLLPREFRPHHLFSSLVRRISMLMTFHTGADIGDTYFVGLKAAGQDVRLQEPRLEYVKDSRWSSRQETEINLSGIAGEFMLDMEKAPTLWPYLWLGQWTHAGKHATEGLGAYRISSV